MIDIKDIERGNFTSEDWIELTNQITLLHDNYFKLLKMLAMANCSIEKKQFNQEEFDRFENNFLIEYKSLFKQM